MHIFPDLHELCGTLIQPPLVVWKQYHTPYPSDVTDDEWAFVSPYPVLMAEAASRRMHDLREIFNSMRWIIRTGLGCPVRPILHDLLELEKVLVAQCDILNVGLTQVLF